jgi:lipase ATG15
MIPFSIVAFLVWLAAPWKMILFFLAIVFLASYSAIKNAYDMSKLGRDLITVQNKKASKIASGGTNERSEAVYLVSSIERITEATACFCWLSFLSEQGLFFIWPSITLLRINWNIGLLFCIVSIASNIRWYINAVTAIEETGKMDLVNGDTEAEKWENKARLNEIVTKISTSDKSYRFWRVMLTSLGFIFVALMISTNEGDGVVQANKEAFTYLPKQYYYPGAKADMLYPSCTMASVESGFGNQSTMLDYAWLANTAYRPKDNITEFDLDVWYNFTDDVVIDEQPIVDEFRARNEDSAVTFKLISIPGPSEGERTAVILIRGTVNQWDALADAQLWSAAALMQWLRYVIPIGELWTPIFNGALIFVCAYFANLCCHLICVCLNRIGFLDEQSGKNFSRQDCILQTYDEICE